jgi:putative membrane protein insertion efficiency factor
VINILSKLKKMLKVLLSIPSVILIGLIRVYQKLSPVKIIPTCRFYPTCSQYFVEALQKYGLIKGSYLGIKRILRCHPYNKGGYDPLK